MTSINETISSLEGRIEDSVRQMYIECIGCEPRSVRCVALKRNRLTIFLERECSEMEKFLLKQDQFDLYSDIEEAVAEILEQKLLQLLETSLELSTDCINRTKSDSPPMLKWLVILRA